MCTYIKVNSNKIGQQIKTKVKIIQRELKFTYLRSIIKDGKIFANGMNEWKKHNENILFKTAKAKCKNNVGNFKFV